MSLVPGRSTLDAIAAATFALGLLLGPSAAAVTLSPGDIVVADRQGLSPARILRIDPASGAATAIYSAFDGVVVSPQDLEIDAQGLVLVSQSSVPIKRSPEGIYRVDPATGAVEVVSEGGSLVDVRGIAIESGGQILAADRGDPYGSAPSIVRVDPVSGAQTILTSGTELTRPYDVAIEPSGQILVLDGGNGSGAKVVRVDPSSGAQTVLVPVGDLGRGPGGIAVASSGSIFVADAFGLLVQVDPASGAVTPLANSPGAPLVDIALDDSANLVALTARSVDKIFRVPLSGGSTSQLPTTLTSPQGLAVVP